MRPPRCYIRYLTAAVKAQSELQLAQYRGAIHSPLDSMELADERAGIMAALVLAVRDRTAELEEHIHNCEECES